MTVTAGYATGEKRKGAERVGLMDRNGTTARDHGKGKGIGGTKGVSWKFDYA